MTLRLAWAVAAAGLVAGVLVAAIVASGRPQAAPEAPRPMRLSPPLRDAEVGESLSLRSPAGDVQVYRVVDSTDRDVTVEVLTYQGDVPLAAPMKQKWSRNAFGVTDQIGVVRAIDPDRIEVQGRSWPCWRITIFGREDVRLFWWITDELPVHGLLKIARILKDGQPDEETAATLVASSAK
jgi:hypothetical protein